MRSLIARRYTRAESLIVGVTTIIYTIPSLALFSLLLPWTQLTPKTAIIGLAHPDFREELERQAYENRLIPRGVSFGCRGEQSDVLHKAQDFS